jgi:CubicO group peptidase (beta-lactamase class C family)
MSSASQLRTDGLTAAFSFADELTSKLDQRLEDEQAASRAPSLVAGIVRDGLVLWWAGRGITGTSEGDPPTADTQYRIGSISKTFVAVAVMRLRDEGALDLSDPIGKHIAELSGAPVTIAQLLSHTSGLRSETAGPWWERSSGVRFADLVASSLRPADFLFRPGRRFHYSNPGYAVLGELIARKRASSFGEVVRDELLKPLGMWRTTLRPVAPFASGLAVHPHAQAVLAEPEHDAVAMAPAGQLWSTIEDLALWSGLLAGKNPEILAADTLSEMTEPLSVSDVPGQPWTGSYGLGLQLWNIDGTRRYGHSGSMPGFVSWLMVDQATAHAVVFVTNTTSGVRPGFCEDLLAIVTSGQPRAAVPFSPNTAGADPRAMELVGTWYWGPREYTVSLCADGRLELRGIPNGRDGTFEPNDDSSYTGEWGYFAGERLEAVRRSDGSLSHLDIGSFVFSKTPYDKTADIPGGVDENGWHAG